jgi:hypothetical protein
VVVTQLEYVTGEDQMQTVIPQPTILIWTLGLVAAVSALAQTDLGETWILEAALRWFLDVDPTDRLLGGFKNDGFVTVRLARYL